MTLLMPRAMDAPVGTRAARPDRPAAIVRLLILCGAAEKLTRNLDRMTGKAARATRLPHARHAVPAGPESERPARGSGRLVTRESDRRARARERDEGAGREHRAAAGRAPQRSAAGAARERPEELGDP